MSTEKPKKTTDFTYKEYYKDKKQKYLDEEAKLSPAEMKEKKTRHFTTIQESIDSNIEKFNKLDKEVVEKWTVVHRMWSDPYLSNITESIRALESVIDGLKNLTPTGQKAWNREDVITFLWNDLDNGKAHLKTALNWINLGSKPNKFD